MHPGSHNLKRIVIWLMVALFALLLVVFLVPQDGLDSQGRWILGIFAFTVILWAFSPLENAAVTLLLLGLLTVAGVPYRVVLSGFASGGFWILLTVLFFGYAMKKTGLARRISFAILSLFPPGYGGILFSFFLIGIVLSLGIPSMTVRTAIMIPIAWALVQAVGLEPRSRGSALIMLSAVEMAVLPGVAFLYGSLWGPTVDRLFASSEIPLSWLAYARVFSLPVLVWCLLLLVANIWLLGPKTPLRLEKNFIRGQLDEIGPWQGREIFTAGVILACILFWTLDSYHGLPSFTVGLFAVALFSIQGTVTHESFSTGIPWALLIFFGGLFSLPEILEANHLDTWLAQYLIPLATPLLQSPLILILALAVAMVVFKFIDPTGFLALTALFLPLQALFAEARIHPLVLTAILILPAHPFWASYQNIWVAMTEGITEKKAFSDAQRVHYSTLYLGVTLVVLLLASYYWKGLELL